MVEGKRFDSGKEWYILLIYIFGDDILRKAKLFTNGRSQAVRLPREFRFKGDAVNIRRVGIAVVLFPEDASWDMLYEALDRFTPDFMADGRNQPSSQDREDPFA